MGAVPAPPISARAARSSAARAISRWAAPGKIAWPKPHKPGPHIHPHWPHKHPHWHVKVKYPRVWYAPRPVVYGAVAPAVAAPVVATNRCTCLTKEYTPEGAVLFKDVCTNEAAINPPAAAPAPTALVQPPQQ